MTPSPSSESHRVAEGLRRGEPEAVEAVRRRVRRIVAYRGLRMEFHERDDLEQEAMAQVWRAVNRASFDPRAGLWGLVEVIVARRLIDRFRARREEVALPRLAVGGPHKRVERHDLARRILERIPEPCRELFALRFTWEKSFAEIGELLGKSEGAARVQMCRCVAHARRVERELRVDGGAERRNG